MASEAKNIRQRHTFLGVRDMALPLLGNLGAN